MVVVVVVKETRNTERVGRVSGWGGVGERE